MANEPGRGRDADDDLTAGPAPFSDEGMRRIIYGAERDGGGRRARDSRSDAFGEDTAELEADLRGRRSLVPIVTALAAVFCFGAIVWYAYTWGTGKMSSEELPVVRAEPLPEKVKPEQPGGMVVEHQSIEVLNSGEETQTAGRVERLLPRPEIPAPPQPLPELPQPVEQLMEEPQPGAAAPEAPMVAGDSTADSTESPMPAEQAPAEVDGVAIPVPKPGSAGGKDQIAELLNQTPMETADGGKPAPEPQPEAQAAAPAKQVAALTTGDVVLQLSSVKSEAAAEAEWKRLKAAHPGLLGDHPLALEKAEVKGTTYFRVQTGPYPSREAAAGVCTKLKARNQDCLVKQR